MHILLPPDWHVSRPARMLRYAFADGRFHKNLLVAADVVTSVPRLREGPPAGASRASAPAVASAVSRSSALLAASRSPPSGSLRSGAGRLG
jgi:hypothetical protein